MESRQGYLQSLPLRQCSESLPLSDRMGPFHKDKFRLSGEGMGFGAGHFPFFILPTLPTLVSQRKGNISESAVEGK